MKESNHKYEKQKSKKKNGVWLGEGGRRTGREKKTVTISFPEKDTSNQHTTQKQMKAVCY